MVPAKAFPETCHCDSGEPSHHHIETVSFQLQSTPAGTGNPARRQALPEVLPSDPWSVTLVHSSRVNALKCRVLEVTRLLPQYRLLNVVWQGEISAQNPGSPPRVLTHKLEEFPAPWIFGSSGWKEPFDQSPGLECSQACLGLLSQLRTANISCSCGNRVSPAGGGGVGGGGGAGEGGGGGGAGGGGGDGGEGFTPDFL